MAFNLKGLGGRASGVLSGVAAVATVIAAIIGILSQFGLISSHNAPKTVAVNTIPGPPLVTKATVAPVVAPVEAAPSAKPSLVAAAPHLHQRRHAKPPPAEVALAEPTASHLGAEDRNLSHLETPGAANTPTAIDNNQSESIAGAWRDQGMGACHLISQTGSKFQVTNYDPATGEVISQGEGTVDGNHVQIDFPKARRPVTVDLHISPNGQWLLGKVTRFDGTRRTMWRYLGPACPKPG
ncbi:MAG: hypothetical protein JO121_28915 [Deltaproteobacteria bacterium]|nr:hypothetical protein [Deltaproteobacteria bacterium]